MLDKASCLPQRRHQINSRSLSNISGSKVAAFGLRLQSGLDAIKLAHKSELYTIQMHQ